MSWSTHQMDAALLLQMSHEGKRNTEERRGRWAENYICQKRGDSVREVGDNALGGAACCVVCCLPFQVGGISLIVGFGG